MTDNSKYHFLRKLKNKYRLVILNDGTFEERVVIKITPLIVLSMTFVVSLVLVFTTFLLFSFTPLKEYVPGKTKLETHKELVKMATKVDSLVTLIEGRDFYVDNLKTILRGGEVIEIKNKSLENNTDNTLDLNVSTEDSLFRLKVEKKSSGDYVSVSSEVNNYFLRPLKGVLIDKYNKPNKHFGVDIVSKVGAIISSVSEGVVVTSDWTKETGFVIAVQHSGGFLSFYKHNSSLLKEVGDYVKKGDPIAVIGNSGELTSGPHLHFELWKNGESVDPENYISF
tara:strand:+ start:4854 stop:5699 length:846 start_codon:yes stop_codon:yes gene_type:complete